MADRTTTSATAATRSTHVIRHRVTPTDRTGNGTIRIWNSEFGIRNSCTHSKFRIPNSEFPSSLIFPPVPILEPHHVVQFRSRHLEDVAVFDCRHPVDGFWRDVHAFAGPHPAFPQRTSLLDLEHQLARVEVNRLVLVIVVLQAQRVPGLHVNQFADVPIGLRPVKLVTPGFLDACHVTAHKWLLVMSDLLTTDSSSRSISSMVGSRRMRRASIRRSSLRSSASTSLATGIAPGVMLNSVSPRPTSSVSNAGSDAISPHSETGMRRRRAARLTMTMMRRIAG